LKTVRAIAGLVKRTTHVVVTDQRPVASDSPTGLETLDDRAAVARRDCAADVRALDPHDVANLEDDRVRRDRRRQTGRAEARKGYS
jgi:hypothetical protein